MNLYYKHYKRLYKKYSNIAAKGSKFVVNWNTKIHKKNSVIESQGRCGGGETRSPRFVDYVAFKKNWNGISFYIDEYISEESLNHCNSPINVAVLMEPRHFKPEIYEAADKNAEHLDVILTHDEYILKKYPDKAVYCIAGAPAIESSRIGMHLDRKSRLLSTCYSRKRDMEGHKFRHDIAELLSDEGNTLDADLYGSGSPSGPIKLKSDTLINHMFSIVVENGICDTYFTEKIMDCFLMGNIPIYRGTKKIGDFFDKRGIIEFSTIEELRFILKNRVNRGVYKNTLPYAERNLEITKRYMYIDDIMLLTTLEHLDNKGFDIINLIRYY